MSDSLQHRDLPIPDYDHIPLATLPQRILPLDADGVSLLLAYEQEHGRRLPVVQVLEHRLTSLADGAEPKGVLAESMPEVTQGSHGSIVTPATSGPTINPPSHGDPTNPAQPR